LLEEKESFRRGKRLTFDDLNRFKDETGNVCGGKGIVRKRRKIFGRRNKRLWKRKHKTF